jgi:hypothetical protein
METQIEEKEEMIGTPEARALIKEHGPAEVSLPTVIGWCKQYHLGVKIGGRWYLYKDKLLKFLSEGGKNGK